MQVIQLDRAFVKGNLTETPEGFLVIDAVVTRPGVFNYMVNGKPHKRYVPPEVVLDEASYKTLALKPVIAGHPYNVPGQLITPETAKEWSKGTVGETIYVDGSDVMAKFTITDKQTIERVKSKELTELSCGYLTNVEFTPGVTPEGIAYDSIQTSRPMYNHLSLERHARVNNALIPGLDGIEVENINEGKKMAIITVNGVSHEVPDGFVPVYERLATGLDAAEKSVTRLTAEKDVLMSEKAKLEKDIEEAKKVSLDADEVLLQARELAQVMTNAKLVGLDAGELSADELKKAVCAKVLPDVSLDGKDAGYISAVYDMAVKQFTESKAPKKTPTPRAVPSLDAADEDKAKTARANMYAPREVK